MDRVHCEAVGESERWTDQHTARCYQVVLGLLPLSFPSLSAHVWQTVGERQKGSDRRRVSVLQKSQSLLLLNHSTQPESNCVFFIYSYSPVQQCLCTSAYTLILTCSIYICLKLTHISHHISVCTSVHLPCY